MPKQQIKTQGRPEHTGSYERATRLSRTWERHRFALSRLLRGGRIMRYGGKVVSCAPCRLDLFSISSPVVFATALIAALFSAPSMAANLYWDTNGTGIGLGGSGPWNTSTQLWGQAADGVSGPYVPWSNGNNDTAVFAGTAGTVTLGNNIVAGGISFNVSGYTVSGANTLTLAGAQPTIVVTGTAEIDATVAGTAGLAKTGGNLILGGTNTFTGGITVNTGTLTVATDAGLGDASNGVTMAAGTALSATGALNSARVVTLTSGQVNLAGAGVGSAHYTGAGGINLTGGVTMSNDSNDFTGPVKNIGTGGINFTSIKDLGVASSLGAPTDATNGTITMSAISGATTVFNYVGTGDSSNRNITLASGTQGAAALRNSGTGALTISGNIVTGGTVNAVLDAATADLALTGVISSTGTTPIQFTDSGAAPRTITLGSANTYGGLTTINNVNVIAPTLASTGTASSLGTGASTGTIALTTNGTLTYTGTGATTDRPFTFNLANGISNNGTGALALTGPLAFVGGGGVDSITLGGSYAGVNTLSGVLSNPGNLIVSGGVGDIWEVSGNNTFTGATTVNGGTLRIANAHALGGATPGALTVNGGGTVDLNGTTITVGSLASTSAGGNVALNGADLTVKGATSTAYSGILTGTGGVTKSNTSTLTLSGANTYTGATTVNGGVLALNFSAAGAPANDIISNTSALNMAGGTLSVTGAAGATNSQTFAATTISAGSNTIGATSGTGGTANINLGAVTHTGGLVNFALPASGNITTSSTTLGGWATVNGTDYAQVTAGNITALTTYTTEDNAANWATGNIVSDTAGSPNTPYSGTTAAGNVQLGGLKYTAAANSTVNIGGRLGVDGTIIVAPSVSSNTTQSLTGGQLTGPVGGGTLGVLQNSTSTFQIASTIVDNGAATGFAKAGTGVVALTGANTYSGGTTISGGTLRASSIANGGQASSIGASSNDPSNLTLESGTLEYTGATTTSDRGITLVNGGPTRTVQVDDANANLTFTGKVTSTDDSDFTKAGGGTLTLANGANDYIGRTVIGGGTLSVNTLANGGLPSGIGASSSDPTNLVLQGGGILNYTGADASTDRSITLTSGGIGVSNVATTLTDSGTIIGAGGFTKTGAGTLVLTGTNTYTGGTEVAAGTLRAGSDQAFGTARTTVDTGATLDLNSFDTSVGSINGPGNVLLGSATLTSTGNGSFSGTISGTGGLLITGNTQTMSGCHNNYTGGTTIRGGSLATDCLANGLQPSGIGASTSDPANLNIQGSGSLVYTGTDVTTDRGILLANGNGGVTVAQSTTTVHLTGQITGAGTLVKSGDGVLVLDNGTNNYTRSTQINAGTLRVGVSGAVPNRGVTFLDAAGATLDLNNINTTILNLSGGGTTGGNVTLGSGTLAISDGNGATFGGKISGTGSVVKSGGGLETFTGSGSSYTGSTTISGGELLAQFLGNGGANSSIGASSSAAANLVLGGGTLGYTGTGGSTDRQFTLSNAGGGLDASGIGAINFTSTAVVTYTGAGAHALTLTGTNTGNNTLAAQVTDSGGAATALNKTGTGTWVLSNTNNTYTGITSITGGVLAVTKLANGGAASSIGLSSNAAANLVIGNNSTLRYTGAGDTTDRQFTLAQGVTFIESSGAGALNFANTGNVTLQGTNATHTIALGGTNTGNNTMGGTISDDGTGQTILAKNDSGTWVLTGNNTYTGNTVVNDGTLVVGNGGTNGNAGSGNVIVANAASTLAVDRSDAFNFNGTLSGPGAFEQRGSGTTVLTETGSSIGAARISGGTLQVNGTLASSTLAMSNTSALTVSGTVDNSGNPLALTGDAGNSTINVNAGGALSANGNLGAGNDTLVVAGTLDTGGARLNLGDGNDGATVNDTTVLTGAGIDGGAGIDALTVDNAAAKTLDGSLIANFENLVKQNTGTLTLTGNHAYTTTTISAGTLQIGNGGATGSLTGNIVDNGTLAINRGVDYTLVGTISGTGGVNQIGGGTTTLTGANSYTGATNVQAGTLLVNGDQSGATGATTVASGATLGGSGTLGGDVSVNDGAHLSPGTLAGEAGTLAIGGNLVLAANSNMDVNFGQANVPGGPLNDLVNVAGDVTLGGTLNVSQANGGTFGPGAYRVINYDGALNGGTMSILPAASLTLQTSVNHQVNLLNTGGVSLTFWDGDAGPQNNSIVNGGNGTWRANGDNNWTGSDGVVNGGFENGGFAVFEGTGGNVAVDNTNGPVQASGMQFASDAYAVSGAPIALTGLQSIIRVGDGTAPGAAYTATISSALSGTSQLLKTDLGTLVLGGANTYTGGTQVNGGTLSIANDNNLGAAAGGLTLNGGTLHTTADLTSARHVALAADSTVSVDGGTTATLSGAVDGAGLLTKTGAGTLALSGDATHSGGTTIAAGTFQVGAGGTTGTLAGDVTDNGRLAFSRSNGLQFDGVISGTGAVEQAGAGSTVLTANNTYTGGTTVTLGTLVLGNGGITGMVAGNVIDNSSLVFDRSDDVTFDGTISGSGSVTHAGGGMLTLTADNAYTGTTLVDGGGTLLINGDQTTGTGNTMVSVGTLGGTGTIGGNVAVSTGAQLSPGSAGNTPGVMNIKGGLNLAAGAVTDVDFGQAGVLGGAFNDLINVSGNLTLNGSINVRQSAGGTFGPGVYRVINYGGTLTNNPVTTNSPDTFVQTSVAKQVNLVNTAGITLRYWDGFNGGKNDSVITGGDGVWQGGTGNDNWTTIDGALNAPFQTSSFAVFEGAPGAVTVDNNQGDVSVVGMQFAVDGYRVTQGTIGLEGPQTEIRVGDGTLAGAGYTATIGSTLTGASQLLKTDLGTLVLAGNNTYSGGTEIDGGKISIASDANLGAATGALMFNGGTLETTANLSMTRPVTMTGNGTFLTGAGTTATVGAAIGGAGALTKDGAGTLVLAGDATHTGGTTIAAGTLQVGEGGTTGSLAGDVTDNATLAFDRSDSLAVGGVISGTGAVEQNGMGTTVLTAENTYTGGTTINAGTLKLGNGGASGMVGGDITDNGTLSFNRSDDIGFGGAITGTGGVSQDGTGVTTLTANNAYTGATTVNGGTLLVQGDQSAASGTTMVSGGTLGGTGTLGGNVSVASGGTLAPGAAAGIPGTLTINGNLSLAAGSNLNVDFGQANVVGGALNDLVNVNGDLTLGGTLNVEAAAGGNLGPGVYRVISYNGNLLGGTLAVGTLPVGSNASVQTSFAHQVNLVDATNTALSFWDGDAGGRGDGQVAGGDGTWRAAGDNDWTTSAGDTNGTFSSASFAVFGGAPGTVTVTGSQGAVNASGMQFAVDGYSVQGDPITLAVTDATIRVGDGTAAGAGYTATINAPLQGAAGVTKTDLGTLVLGGASSYTGPTTVAGGTLRVEGNIASSAVTVASGATVSGNGTVGTTTVNTGGTVTPGSSIGTLNVAGNYVQQSGATYQAEVDPASTASDRIAVTGTATLQDGAVLNVTKTANSAYVPGTRYTVLTAAGGVNGTFTVTGDTALSSFIGLTGAQDANNAYLVIGQTRPVASVGNTSNQTATGRGVDSLPIDNPLKLAVLNLGTDAAARGALNALSGEIHASIQTASLQDSHFVRDAATDRLRDTFCGVGSQTDRRDANGAPVRAGGADCNADAHRPAGWVRVFGGWQHTDSDGNAASMNDSTSGLFVGADAPVGQNGRVGVMAGYSHSNVDVNARNSSGSSDNYHLGVYGGAQWGALGLRTGAAYTWQDISTSRSVNIAGFSDSNGASYDAGMGQVFGDLGYRIDAGRFSYEPFANVAYVKLHTDSFTENGGAAALHSPGDNSDVTFSTLGMRASAAINLGGTEGTLRGSLGWRHAFGDTTPVSTLQFQGGQQFGVAGVPIAQDAAVLDAGVDLNIAKNTVLGFSYGGQFAGSSNAQSVQATLKVRF
jgi:fibronectin-binding autotransporter adhesin